MASFSKDPKDHSYSINPDDYQVDRAVGFGSSAIVYAAVHTPTGKLVAIKMIELDRFERNQIDELRKEIRVMSMCKHPHLLPILATFVNSSRLWIVTPFRSGGSCLDIMKSHYRDGLEETVICCILYQTLLGLDYLHKNGHIHRDIKAGNLLVDEDGTVNLADFGVSSSLADDGDRKSARKTFVGTPCWMAPEVMEMTKGYNAKADIWSLGITALELAYGSAPFAKYPPMKVIYLTLSSSPPTLDRSRTRHKYSRAFKEMIDSCLQRDPNKRPTAETLLKQGFFKNAGSRKSEYLKCHLLDDLPELVTAIADDKVYDPNPTETTRSTLVKAWDFGGGGEEGKNGESVQSGGTQPNAPSEVRKGRFSVIESGCSPSVGSGSTLNRQERSSRFEVVTVNDDPAAASQPGISALFLPDPDSKKAAKEDRKSRFTIQPADPGPDQADLIALIETQLGLDDKQKSTFRRLMQDKTIVPGARAADSPSPASILQTLGLVEKQLVSLFREHEELKAHARK